MIELKESKDQRALFVKGVCQGVVSIDGLVPRSPYMLKCAKIIQAIPEQSNALFLGGGLFILPSLSHRGKISTYVFESNKDVIYNVQDKVNIKDFNVYIKDAQYLDGNFPPALKFDYILLDCYDGAKKSGRLYEPAYFKKLKNRLTDVGILNINYVCNSECVINKMGKELIKLFKNVSMDLIFSDKEQFNVEQVLFTCGG